MQDKFITYHVCKPRKTKTKTNGVSYYFFVIIIVIILLQLGREREFIDVNEICLDVNTCPFPKVFPRQHWQSDVHFFLNRCDRLP